MLRFHQRSNGLLIRCVYANLKRKTANAKGLPQKHIDRRRQINAKFAIQSLTLFLHITIHTDIYIHDSSHIDIPFLFERI